MLASAGAILLHDAALELMGFLELFLVFRGRRKY
jgi:hypothetical protein